MSLEALKRNGHNLHIDATERVGKYGVPQLQPFMQLERINWIPFNYVNTTANRAERGVHFFIDDYMFLRAWNDPERYAKLLSEFKCVMSPDFSLFTDYPPAVQIYNHWRKHLLAAYWQNMGISVIPSICWSDEASFEWCFDGEPIGGTVAVSSVGTQKNPTARENFKRGYDEMLSRLKPTKIIFFGDVPAECDGTIEKHGAYYFSLAHSQKKR